MMHLPTLLVSLSGLICAMASWSFGQGTKNQDKAPRLETAGDLAVVQTSMGTIEIQLFGEDAPKTVENFKRLSESHYYDGLIFHRVVRGFVIQGGDPTGTGAGGSSIWGKPFEDELNPATPSFKQGYRRGVVAMANRGPNTNTSQFFILLKDQLWMPKNYTIFGKVISGMDVVEAIGDVEIRPPTYPQESRPAADVVIKTVTIRKAEAKDVPPPRAH